MYFTCLTQKTKQFTCITCEISKTKKFTCITCKTKQFKCKTRFNYLSKFIFITSDWLMIHNFDNIAN